MSVFKADCPHCGTRSVGFTITSEHRAHMTSSDLWDTLAFCHQCSRGILATFKTPAHVKPKSLVGSKAGISPLNISPSPPSTGAPQHVPDNVAEYYRQGMDNLQGNWTAAGMMFRKTLDIGLKVKFPDISGSLKARIDAAAERGGLTADLAEWAHQIRLDGNVAAHEEEPSEEEDAQRLCAFTRLVLLYLFSLPGMLEKARSDAEEEAGEHSEPSCGLP